MKKNGFTLIEMLTSIAIFGVSLAAVAAFSTISSSLRQKNSVRLVVTQTKSQILTNLSNGATWRRHISTAGQTQPGGSILNPDLACLRDGTACVESTYDLTVVDQAGNIILNANNPNQGFTKSGETCLTYQPNGANPACPWRLEVKWSPVCPLASDGPCVRPQVTLQLQIQSSTDFLSENTLNTIQASVLVEQPHYDPPFARKITATTNSTHYDWDSTSTVNVLGYIYADSPGTISVSAPATSQMGGTVTVNGTSLVYNAPPGYYGSDWFNYTFHDSYTGFTSTATMLVKVMTPWTWTGLGGNQLTSTTQNFCGMVTAGNCDGATFPASESKNLIFNENCTLCIVQINTPTVNTLRLMPNFPGQVTLTTNLSVTPHAYWTPGLWVPTPFFSQQGGVFNGNGHTLSVDGADYPWSIPATDGIESFNIGGGTFNAPALLRVTGSFTVTNSNSFKHSDGLVNFFNIFGSSNRITAENVNFFNVQFDNPLSPLGNSFGVTVTKNFTVLRHLRQSPRGSESAIRGINGAIISVKGNVYLQGAGGTFTNSPGTIQLNGTTDQLIVGQPAPAATINPNLGNVAHSLAFLPMVQIKKNSGTVTVSDWVGLGGFEVLEVPTGIPGVIVDNTNLVFSSYQGDIPFAPGDIAYNNIYWVPGNGSNADIVLKSPLLKINGNLYHYTQNYSHIYGLADGSGNGISQVNLYGNLYIDGGFDHDRLQKAVTVNMIGAKDSIIQGSTITTAQVHIVVNKDAGYKVTIRNGFNTSRDLTLIKNTATPQLIIDPDVTVKISSHGWNNMTSIFNTPDVVFYDFDIDHNFRLTTDLNMDGHLSIGTHGGGAYSLSLGGPGTFRLKGNLNIGSGLPYGGGSPIEFVGSNNSTINVTADVGTQKNLQSTSFIINKTGSAEVKYTAGNIKAQSFNLKGTNNIFTMNTGTNLVMTSTAKSVASTQLNLNGATINAASTDYQGTVNP